MPSSSTPLHIVPLPVATERELEPLLTEPFASAWAAEATAAAPVAGPLRGRLMARLAAARTESAAMHTVRTRRLAQATLAPGVAARTLYAAPADRPARRGEPLCARRIDLEPGSQWAGPDAAGQREWLVLGGSVLIGADALGPRDYHVLPAGCASGPLRAGPHGARLFLRESVLAAAPGDAALTVRDAEAGWPAFAPGIRRRVLWQRDGQAALLYQALPGAAVPRHAHGHDEECLMVQGELFLDDLLLQEGDYQLAPAGSGHRITETDTGVVIYAHGDLDLRFVD